MKSLALFLALVLLSSCGGAPNNPWGTGSARFVNRTLMPEATFQAMAEQNWKDAQEAIASAPSYDLTGKQISEPDARSLQIEPQFVIVQSADEVSASELNALPQCNKCPYLNPSGVIDCPPNASNVKYCDAYMETVCKIYVPASKPHNMGPYEMENCILAVMGKDVRLR